MILSALSSEKKTGDVKVCSSKQVATLTLCNCLAITGITLFSTV
jgi:hypothetical protein